MTINVPEEVLTICRVLKDKGFSAHIVGGSVRDAILGKSPKDWDICTSAKPEIVMGLFSKVIPSGIEFGTVTVMVNGEGFEITTLRGDGNYSDGRRPDSVKFIDDITEDLSRRDLTINAMAFDPIEGVLADPFNGAKDLKAGLIKAVGKADDRFKEDGLRVMRAIRFASRFGFEIEADTLRAIKDNAEVLKHVSPERIRDEFVKILVSDHVETGLNLLKDSDLFKIFCPEAEAIFNCSQNHFHDFDVWGHTIAAIKNVPANCPLLRIAAFLHDIGKPAVKEFDERRGEFSFIDHQKVSADIAENVLRRLKFSNEDREFVKHLVLHHMDAMNKNMKNAGVRRFINKVGKDHLKDFFILHFADKAGSRKEGLSEEDRREFAEFKNRCEAQKDFVPNSSRNLAVNGHDVMKALGIKPGPKVGKILNILMEHVLDVPEDNNIEALMVIVFKHRSEA